MKIRASKPLKALVSLLLFGMLLSICSCSKKGEEQKTRVITTKTGNEMVVIPTGSFQMGSNRGKDDEKPVHEVWIDAFLMDKYEMTQHRYVMLAGNNPSHFLGPNNPADTINWADAALYCNMLSIAESLEPCYDEETAECNFAASGYRLPTEAEWEYACRAGSRTEYVFGQDSRQLQNYGWFKDNSLKKTHPVGEKKPNKWGLYDMYGNISEWCNDVYLKDYYQNSPEKNPQGPKEGDLQVLRGGSWDSKSEQCRSSSRLADKFGFVDACIATDTTGFRCVRKLLPEEREKLLSKSSE